MSPQVGFYVHHHGLGHLMRTGAILAHLDSPATVLTSADTSRVDLHGAEVVPLPLDTDDRPACPPSPPLRGLHYAPVGSRGLQERTARIAAWATARRPDLLVVDVSAEVTLLGRLLALPVVTMRQHGRRWDPVHLAAYGASHALLAPYPEELEELEIPRWAAERTFYSGGFSRYDHRIEPAASVGREPGPPRVTVLIGAGGDAPSYDGILQAVAACPNWEWLVLGRPAGGAPGAFPPNLRHLPWAADVFGHLRRSDVVVTGGSHNSVMEVAAAGRPLVCLPQPRPFDEQVHKAERLRASGTAVVREGWPPSEEWPGLLEEARRLEVRNLAGLVDGHGARRAAGFLDGLAREFGRMENPEEPAASPLARA